jgi:hypothetical protein
MNNDGPVSSEGSKVGGQQCGTLPNRASGPRWLSVFLGRELLRVCPYAHKDEPCRGCRLRALCRCAQENLASAAAIEKRVWAVLAVCGAAAILYAAFAFLHSL